MFYFTSTYPLSRSQTVESGLQELQYAALSQTDFRGWQEENAEER